MSYISLAWLGFAFISAVVAESKNRPFTKWLMLGIAGGPITLIAAISMKALPPTGR